MSSNDTGRLPGRARAGPAAVAGAEATQEERAAAGAMLRMIWGVHISRAVYVAAELGIPDLLAAGPATAAHLAKATQAHEPSLYRVLRLLASLGVLTEHDGGAFSLTVVGERLRTDVPASMRSWAMLLETVGGVRSFEPIVERLIPANPADAVPVLLSDLNMLVITGGQERTNAKYSDLLAAAGLATAAVHPLASPYGVIEGYAA